MKPNRIRVSFRAAEAFGRTGDSTWHARVDDDSWESDIANALYTAAECGHADVVLYVSTLSTLGLAIAWLRRRPGAEPVPARAPSVLAWEVEA